MIKHDTNVIIRETSDCLTKTIDQGSPAVRGFYAYDYIILGYGHST